MNQSYLRTLWHISHALVWLMVALVLSEKLIPGSVLGHWPLFSGVPLLIICIGLQPPSQKPRRWRSSLDLIVVALILGVRIFQQLFFKDTLSSLLAVLATVLLVACVGVCLSNKKEGE